MRQIMRLNSLTQMAMSAEMKKTKVPAILVLCSWACLLGQTAQAQTPDEPKPPRTLTSRAQKHGLKGWGLALEVPMVGLSSGQSDANRVGNGYALGAAVAWDITRHIQARTFIRHHATSDGNATITYFDRDSGARIAENVPANWLSWETGLGVSYFFRDTKFYAIPFVGIDLCATFGGWEYSLDDSLQAEIDFATDYGTGENFATDFGIDFAARAGMQLELTPWLAAVAEARIQFAEMSEDSVSNTVAAREVRSEPQSLVFLAATMSLRFAL